MGIVLIKQRMYLYFPFLLILQAFQILFRKALVYQN